MQIGISELNKRGCFDEENRLKETVYYFHLATPDHIIWDREPPTSIVKVRVYPGCNEKAEWLTLQYPAWNRDDGWIDGWPQKICLRTTPVNFPAQDYTGFRYWFLCPQCGRRIGTLYKPIGYNFVFACRHSHNLSYDSRNSHPDRAVNHVVNKILQLTYGKDWINHPDVQTMLKEGESDEKVRRATYC